jgi:hypothetical protein
MPIAISHPSLLLAFRVLLFHVVCQPPMEDKKGVKYECSPSAEGSHLPDDAKTPIPVSSGSPPTSGSPSDVSSRRRCSLVFEQGGASGVTPVSGVSSLVVDTSHDEEFARKLFGELNHDILGPPGDGKIIIIDDSDDDDTAQEEGTTDIDPTIVPASAADAPAGISVTNSDAQGSEQEVDGGSDSKRSINAP